MDFEEEIELLQDNGFLGHKPKNAKVRQPFKNTKLKPLTEQQKQENKELSSKRIRVEHAICGVKRLRIVKDTFRNRKDNVIDIAMQIACGLHNLRNAA
jgi:hypothetical protein